MGQCIDKIWCNEGAMCWDNQLDKSAPCSDVSLRSEIFPLYPQCPGSPAPATALFDSKYWGAEKQCHKKHRTTGHWGDLGQEVSQETCQKACRLWKSCKYVSFEPVLTSGSFTSCKHGQCAPVEQKGICTSFTSCKRKTSAKGQTTWEKVLITSSPDCEDQNSKRWCSVKSKQGMCTKPFVAKKCARTCGICDRRRLQIARIEQKPIDFV